MATNERDNLMAEKTFMDAIKIYQLNKTTKQGRRDL